MAVEVRYESGPFAARNADYLWLLLNVVQGDDESRQVVVRLGPKLTEKVWGPEDAFWWFAARAGADRLRRAHRGGGTTPRTIHLTADDMRRALSDASREPEPLAEGVVLGVW